MQKCKKLDFAVFSESQGRENITRTKEFSFAENLLLLAINALPNNGALRHHLSELLPERSNKLPKMAFFAVLVK